MTNAVTPVIGSIEAGERVRLWKGKPVDSLDRDELIEAVKWLSQTLEETLADHTRVLSMLSGVRDRNWSGR